MLNAVYACLLPLAKLLLRSGITYRQFDAIAKRAFVREAMADSDPRGRPTNTSRIAVRTGLSRKDVKKQRESLSVEASSPSGSLADQSGPPSRVLHAWHVDRRFLDSNGRPMDLEFQDGDPSFGDLVRAVAGDVPPGAVRTELRRSGAIIDLDDGRLRAIKRYYVPGNVDEKAITVISGMLFPLACGVVHNSDPTRTTDGFFQRFAFSQTLTPEAIPAFRIWSRAQATSFIEDMDDWLAQHEADDGVAARQVADQRTVGIGVFYYDGPSAEAAICELTSERR